MDNSTNILLALLIILQVIEIMLQSDAIRRTYEKQRDKLRRAIKKIKVRYR